MRLASPSMGLMFLLSSLAQNSSWDDCYTSGLSHASATCRVSLGWRAWDRQVPGQGPDEGALPISLGMWGSAFAASLDEIFLKIAGLGLGFLDWHRGSVNITGEGRDSQTPLPLASNGSSAEV